MDCHKYLSRVFTDAAFAVATSLTVIAVAHAQAAPTIRTVAGNGQSQYSGDGGPARDARLEFASSVATDSAGNFYILDRRIRKVSNGIITAYAGNGSGGYSGDGGPALEAGIDAIVITIDAQDNLYIGDTQHHVIRKVTPAGVISTIAGTGTAGFSGDGGPAINAMLGQPAGLATDATGNLYFSDHSTGRVRKITLDGKIHTVAGNGGIGFGGDGGPALAATFQFPSGLSIDASGNIFVADTWNHRIRKISIGGTISTVAGEVSALQLPRIVRVATDGTLYIAESGTYRVAAVKPDGRYTTVAGNGLYGYFGDGGPASQASLQDVQDIALGENGNIYIADGNNPKIREVIMVPVAPDPPTITNIVPGIGSVTVTVLPPLDDGGTRITGYGVQCFSASRFTDASSNDITVPGLQPGVPVFCVATADNAAGRSLPSAPSATVVPLEPPHTPPGPPLNVELSLDEFNNTRIRFMPPDNDGGSPVMAYYVTCGDSFGPLFIGTNTQTYLSLPPALPISCTVRAKNVYDIGPPSAPSNIITPIAGPFTPSDPPVIGTATPGINSVRIAFTPPVNIGAGTISQYTATCGNAHASRIASPITVSGLPAGVPVGCTVKATNVYGSSAASGLSNSVTPLAGPRVLTIAGTGNAGYNGNGGPAFNAELYHPNGLAVDASGKLFVTNGGNAFIKQVSVTGAISIVGAYHPTTGTPLYVQPWDIAVSGANNLLISDPTTGMVTGVNYSLGTAYYFAGNSSATQRGDGGPALNAKLMGPRGLAVDGAGIVYIADALDMRIRKVALDGTISTYAGNGTAEFSGDGGLAIDAGLNEPTGLAIDAGGNLYVADTSNGRIRVVTPAGFIGTVAGGGTGVSCAADGEAIDVCLAAPISLVLDAGGNLYIAESDGGRIRKLSTDGAISTVANIDEPNDMAIDADGNLLVSDRGNRVRKILISGATPGAPTGVVATPGVNQLIVNFIPATEAGSKPISGYFALCDGVYYGYAQSSPIVVDKSYLGPPASCTVTAMNSIGPGTPSAASTYVNSLPPASTSLRLVKVSSRKTHGAAGTFDLPLVNYVSVEPRAIDTGHVIVFEFNEPINNMGGAFAAELNGWRVFDSTVSSSGNEVHVTLPHIPNAVQATINLWGINGLINTSFSVGFLLGDVNSSRTVDVDDRSAIKLRAGQAADANNFLYDINASGVISAADISLVKARRGGTFP